MTVPTEKQIGWKSDQLIMYYSSSSSKPLSAPPEHWMKETSQ